MPPIKFQLNRTNGLGDVVFQDIGMILAILNLHVATMPPTKFHLNRTYHSGDVKNMKG